MARAKRVPFKDVVLLCGAHTLVLYCDGDFNWLGQVLGGGGEI